MSKDIEKVMPNSITRIGPYKIKDTTEEKWNEFWEGEPVISGSKLRRFEIRAVRFVLNTISDPDPFTYSFARKSIGLTREKFADKLNVEINDVVRWETGEVKPNELQKLAIKGLLNESDPRIELVED